MTKILTSQETAIHTPTHKDYRPDVTQAGGENDSEYQVEEEDNTADGQDDYEDEYDNGMPDKKKKRRKKWFEW